MVVYGVSSQQFFIVNILEKLLEIYTEAIVLSNTHLLVGSTHFVVLETAIQIIQLEVLP